MSTSFVTQTRGRSTPTSFASPGQFSDYENAAKYGRVIDVIIDSSHPRYQELGGTQALYGVFYQPLFGRAEEEIDDYSLRFAYCRQATVKQIPVKTEVVLLEQCLAAEGAEERGGNVYQEKTYWVSIVPVWNHPHLNLYPDTVKLRKQGGKVDLGPDFKENPDIRPLQLCSGDIAVEGRHGQSLRFGGTQSPKSPISGSSGSPYTILRNGQAKAQGDTCLEDINKDDSSIWLVSNHKVPLQEANRKFAGAKTAPPQQKDYQGKQIVVNSDRVFLNAKENDIHFSAKRFLSANAETVSVDAEKYIGLDANKVYLGNYGQTEREPVLKGQTTIDLINDCYGAIAAFLSAISKPAPPPVWVPNAATQAAFCLAALKSYMSRINSLKSKKVFTE